MNTYEITYQQLKERFEESGHDVHGFLAPLVALCDDSSSLIVGYGNDDSKVRENMVPYFHLVGRSDECPPLRSLLIGSWVGTEPVSSLAVARLIAALESEATLANGMEVTGVPVLNMSAYRQGVVLTGEQQKAGVTPWKNSTTSHVVVFEREIQRYPYDLVLNFRVDSHAKAFAVIGWTDAEVPQKVASDPLMRYAETSPSFQWVFNPEDAKFERTFTPVPNRENNQPVEITLVLPGMLSADEQTLGALKLALLLLNQFRQARVEGLV